MSRSITGTSRTQHPSSLSSCTVLLTVYLPNTTPQLSVKLYCITYRVPPEHYTPALCQVVLYYLPCTSRTQHPSSLSSCTVLLSVYLPNTTPQLSVKLYLPCTSRTLHPSSLSSCTVLLTVYLPNTTPQLSVKLYCITYRVPPEHYTPALCQVVLYYLPCTSRTQHPSSQSSCTVLLTVYLPNTTPQLSVKLYCITYRVPPEHNTPALCQVVLYYLPCTSRTQHPSSLSSCTVLLTVYLPNTTPQLSVKLYCITYRVPPEHYTPALCQVVLYYLPCTSRTQHPSSLSSCTILLTVYLPNTTPQLSVKLYCITYRVPPEHNTPALSQVVLYYLPCTSRTQHPSSLSSCTVLLTVYLPNTTPQLSVKLYCITYRVPPEHNTPALCQVVLYYLPCTSRTQHPSSLSSCTVLLTVYLPNTTPQLSVKLYCITYRVPPEHNTPALCQVVLYYLPCTSRTLHPSSLSSCTVLLTVYLPNTTPQLSVKLYCITYRVPPEHNTPALCQVVLYYLPCTSRTLHPSSLSNCTVLLTVYLPNTTPQLSVKLYCITYRVPPEHYTPALCQVVLTVYLPNTTPQLSVKLYCITYRVPPEHNTPALCQVVLYYLPCTSRTQHPSSLSSCTVLLTVYLPNTTPQLSVKLYCITYRVPPEHYTPALCQVVLYYLPCTSRTLHPSSQSSCTVLLTVYLPNTTPQLSVKLYCITYRVPPEHYTPALCQVVLYYLPCTSRTLHPSSQSSCTVLLTVYLPNTTPQLSVKLYLPCTSRTQHPSSLSSCTVLLTVYLPNTTPQLSVKLYCITYRVPPEHNTPALCQVVLTVYLPNTTPQLSVKLYCITYRVPPEHNTPALCQVVLNVRFSVLCNHYFCCEISDHRHH